jgi:hypothetical protein
MSVKPLRAPALRPGRRAARLMRWRNGVMAANPNYLPTETYVKFPCGDPQNRLNPRRLPPLPIMPNRGVHQRNLRRRALDLALVSPGGKPQANTVRIFVGLSHRLLSGGQATG